ncbi:Unconventional myosin-IXAa [Cichlidogyrus casuarinus]|uniref:Unconventional myosin-IXAa n=1 Tax=Cichlidogyrus casuarinus TaxID=1844966 RepID=A0ABD2QQ18_9PLAT
MNAHLTTEYVSYKQSKSNVSNNFAVAHYAGNVIYDVSGFLEKNRDRMSNFLVQLLRQSTLTLLSDLYHPDSLDSSGQWKERVQKTAAESVESSPGLQRSNSLYFGRQCREEPAGCRQAVASFNNFENLATKFETNGEKSSARTSSITQEASLSKYCPACNKCTTDAYDGVASACHLTESMKDFFNHSTKNCSGCVCGGKNGNKNGSSVSISWSGVSSTNTSKKISVTTNFRHSLAALLSHLLKHGRDMVRKTRRGSKNAPPLPPRPLGLLNRNSVGLELPAKNFDREVVMRQLHDTGVLETIVIRQYGYPIRFTYSEFLKRYCAMSIPPQRLLNNLPAFHSLMTHNEGCNGVEQQKLSQENKELLHAFVEDMHSWVRKILASAGLKIRGDEKESLWVLGRDKVLMKARVLKMLDLRLTELHQAVKVVQAIRSVSHLSYHLGQQTTSVEHVHTSENNTNDAREDGVLFERPERLRERARDCANNQSQAEISSHPAPRMESLKLRKSLSVAHGVVKTSSNNSTPKTTVSKMSNNQNTNRSWDSTSSYQETKDNASELAKHPPRPVISHVSYRLSNSVKCPQFANDTAVSEELPDCMGRPVSWHVGRYERVLAEHRHHQRAIETRSPSKPRVAKCSTPVSESSAKDMHVTSLERSSLNINFGSPDKPQSQCDFPSTRLYDVPDSPRVVSDRDRSEDITSEQKSVVVNLDLQNNRFKKIQMDLRQEIGQSSRPVP